MDLTFQIPSFEYMVDSIIDMESEKTDESFKGSLFYFYPKIDKGRYYSVHGEARKEYLAANLKDQLNKDLFESKIAAYNTHWNENKTIITEAFQDAFKTDLREDFNDMVGYISLNPVCPRFLDTRSFEVFYLNSERGALGMALHEIVHFVWFKLWSETFHDNHKDYESPHLKWVFSEIIPELIIRDERLRIRNPYANGNVIYEYFYKMSIDGNPLLETLYELYTNLSMREFMEKGFQLIQEHEQEIRDAMHI